MNRGPFEKRVVIVVAGVGVLSLLAFLVLMLFGDEVGGVSSSGSDSYSRSAVGHQAFVKFLERLDIPISVSRFASADKARAGSVLVIAEPAVSLRDEEAAGKLARMIEGADAVLLVLPKWRTTPDPKRRGFAGAAHLLSPESVLAVLKAAGIEADIERVAKGEARAVWRRNDLGGSPSLRFAQFLDSAGVDPIVRADRGILVGEVPRRGGRLMVLADPDVISNHGLGRGDNALLAAAMVRELGAGAKPVVVDETLHGHEVAPNIWRSLFTLPLGLATAQGAVLLLLLLWAAGGRFGAPLPPEPGLARGKGLLIANTAALLQFGGHSKSVLDRYLLSTLREVAQALHAPSDLDGAELNDWLAAVGARRSTTIDPRHLAREVKRIGAAGVRAAAGIPALAGEIHRYKEEILNGPGDHSRGDG